MRRDSLFGAIALVLAALLFGQGGGPASKATAKWAETTLLEATDPIDWVPILSQTIKTPSKKDLLLNVSLETGLLTSTEVKAGGKKSKKKAKKELAVAEAAVQVRVLVDGVVAPPGAVTYAARRQELSASFKSIVAGCVEVEPQTGRRILTAGCEQDPEVASVLERSLEANSFQFIVADCGVGDHEVVVEVRLRSDSIFEAGIAEAWAFIGKGTFTAEVVRFVEGEDVELD